MLPLCRVWQLDLFTCTQNAVELNHMHGDWFTQYTPRTGQYLAGLGLNFKLVFIFVAKQSVEIFLVFIIYTE